MNSIDRDCLRVVCHFVHNIMISVNVRIKMWKEFLVCAVKSRDRCACMHLMKNADGEKRQKRASVYTKKNKRERDDRRLKQETRHFRWKKNLCWFHRKKKSWIARECTGTLTTGNDNYKASFIYNLPLISYHCEWLKKLLVRDVRLIAPAIRYAEVVNEREW